jgi:hypothetical protein
MMSSNDVVRMKRTGTEMDFLETRSDDSIRKEIRGIRDSYHHYWDLLAELLQNSRDAINRKRKAGGVGPFFILITVDASNNRIEVQDNGTGIPKSLIHEMLAPGGGDKDGTRIQKSQSVEFFQRKVISIFLI